MKSIFLIICLTFFVQNSFAGPELALETATKDSDIITELIKKHLLYLPQDSFKNSYGKELNVLTTKLITEETEKMNQKKKLVNKNNLHSTIIFWFVHVCILIGLIASTSEFIQSYKYRRSIPQQQTEIVVKMEELALKTTSTGIIMLIISLVFYFLYLKFVYQVVLI